MRLLRPLLVLAIAGALTLAASTAASAAPVPRPGAGKPASVGGPATGTVSPGAARISAVGIDLCAQICRRPRPR